MWVEGDIGLLESEGKKHIIWKPRIFYSPHHPSIPRSQFNCLLKGKNCRCHTEITFSLGLVSIMLQEKRKTL